MERTYWGSLFDKEVWCSSLIAAVDHEFHRVTLISEDAMRLMTDCPMPGSMCHSISCTASLVYLQNYKYEEEAQTCMSATMVPDMKLRQLATQVSAGTTDSGCWYKSPAASSAQEANLQNQIKGASLSVLDVNLLPSPLLMKNHVTSPAASTAAKLKNMNTTVASVQFKQNLEFNNVENFDSLQEAFAVQWHAMVRVVILILWN